MPDNSSPRRKAMIEYSRRWQIEHGLVRGTLTTENMADFALEMLGDQEPATTEVKLTKGRTK